eukprot:sb/3477334/
MQFHPHYQHQLYSSWCLCQSVGLTLFSFISRASENCGQTIGLALFSFLSRASENCGQSIGLTARNRISRELWSKHWPDSVVSQKTTLSKPGHYSTTHGMFASGTGCYEM